MRTHNIRGRLHVAGRPGHRDELRPDRVAPLLLSARGGEEGDHTGAHVVVPIHASRRWPNIETGEETRPDEAIFVGRSLEPLETEVA